MISKKEFEYTVGRNLMELLESEMIKHNCNHDLRELRIYTKNRTNRA